MNTNLLWSSSTMTWETPISLFKDLNNEFHFNLDVCAEPETAKCDKYFTKSDDALKQEWNGVCWMNPPYGRDCYKWIEKAYNESLRGCTVVCLVASRTDTKWFHEFAVKGELRFIKGRLKFGGSNNSAPFPSLIVIFRPKK